MRKILFIIGLFATLAASGQGTIQTLRDAGDSTATSISNLYLYGVAGSTEYVFRPDGIYAVQGDSLVLWVTASQLADSTTVLRALIALSATQSALEDTASNVRGSIGDTVSLAGTPDYITQAGQVLTLNQIDLAADVTGALSALSIGTGVVSNAEFANLNNSTSEIQSQLNAKASQTALNDTASAIRGDFPAGGGDLLSTNNLSDLTSASTALTNLGLTATAAEINYTDGVTSNIQTQLDAKADAADSIVVEYRNGLTATESVTGDSMFVDVDDVDLTAGVTGVLPVANLPTQTTITDTDASIPTSGAVVDYVAANGGGGGTGGYSILSFTVGTTVNAPSVGDSLLTHGSIDNAYLDVWRGGQYDFIGKQRYRDTLGYEVTDSTIMFHPEFASGDYVEVWVYDSTNITQLTLRDTTTESEPTAEVDSSTWIQEFKDVYYAWTDPPSLDTADMYNDYVYSLDSAGMWAERDLVYVMSVKNATDALINWTDPTAGTFDLVEQGAGALTFTQYEGFTGDGTNYFDAGWTPSTHAVNYQLDSASASVYILNDIAATPNAVMGAYAADGNDLYILPRYTGDFFYARVNSGTPSLTYSHTTTSGYWTIVRRADDDNEAYKNGTSVATTTTASAALVGSQLKVFTRDQNEGMVTSQISLLTVGFKMSDDEAALDAQITNRLMTRLGINVY